MNVGVDVFKSGSLDYSLAVPYRGKYTDITDIVEFSYVTSLQLKCSNFYLYVG